eukprot:scaffold2456_cov129-Isochrysis_galbana.AAC.10
MRTKPPTVIRSNNLLRRAHRGALVYCRGEHASYTIRTHDKHHTTRHQRIRIHVGAHTHTTVERRLFCGVHSSARLWFGRARRAGQPLNAMIRLRTPRERGASNHLIRAADERAPDL